MKSRGRAPKVRRTKNGVTRKKPNRAPAPGPTPAQLDPTRTTALRRTFAAALANRFRRFKQKLYELIVVEDALGLKSPAKPFPLGNSLGGGWVQAEVVVEPVLVTEWVAFAPLLNAGKNQRRIPKGQPGGGRWVKVETAAAPPPAEPPPPPSKPNGIALEQSIRDGYRAIADEPGNKMLGGIVKIPDLVDRVRAQHPGASATEVHHQLEEMQKKMELTLQLCNDPRLEPRQNEGIWSPRGLLMYVRMQHPVPTPVKPPPSDLPDEEELKGLTITEGDAPPLPPPAPVVAPSTKYVRGPNEKLPNQARPELTTEQRQRLAYYTASGYIVLNEALRGINPGNEHSTQLDAVMEKVFDRLTPFATPVTTYRGMTLDEVQLRRFADGMETARASGEPVRFPSYLSTTTHPESTNGPYFGGNVSMVLTTNYGIDAKPFAAAPSEEELILDKGSTFRVDGVEKTDWGYRVLLTQLNQPGQRPVAPTPAAPPPNQPGLFRRWWNKLTGNVEGDPRKFTDTDLSGIVFPPPRSEEDDGWDYAPGYEPAANAGFRPSQHRDARGKWSRTEEGKEKPTGTGKEGLGPTPPPRKGAAPAAGAYRKNLVAEANKAVGGNAASLPRRSYLARRAQGVARPGEEAPAYDAETYRHWELEHRTAVEDALAAGKKLPHEVLRDYPELVPARPKRVLYTGVKLSEGSRARLLTRLADQIPEGWTTVAHHMTLDHPSRPGFAPLSEDEEGRGDTLTVTHVARDHRVLAVKVKPSRFSSRNATAHITIATNPAAGGKPVHSNELTNWMPVKRPFTLSGRATNFTTNTQLNLPRLARLVRKLNLHPGRMPGYGQVYVRPERGEVWYVGGDGDSREFYTLVKRRLERFPGVRKVHYEAESSPKEQGWQPVRIQGQRVDNRRWEFRSSPDQVAAFGDWVRAQFADDLLGADDAAVWEKYIQQGFLRGAAAAYDDLKKDPAAQGKGKTGLNFYAGSREAFLRSAFARPETAEKLKLLVGRTLTDLKGVTEQMATVMTRTLADGLVRGANPRTIAAELAAAVDSIGIARARTIAQTEIIRAHAEAQLGALEALGVEGVRVEAEWSTAGDKKVCPRCKPNAGRVLTVAEARGLIPYHPNCRCSWKPVVKVPAAERGEARPLTPPPEEFPQLTFSMPGLPAANRSTFQPAPPPAKPVSFPAHSYQRVAPLPPPPPTVTREEELLSLVANFGRSLARVANADEGIPLRDPNTGAVVGSGGNCGTGAGGFQPGNTCATGKGGRKGTPARGSRAARAEVDSLLAKLRTGRGSLTTEERAQLVTGLLRMTVADLRQLATQNVSQQIPPRSKKAQLVLALGKALERHLSNQRAAVSEPLPSSLGDPLEAKGASLYYVSKGGERGQDALTLLFNGKPPSEGMVAAGAWAPDGTEVLTEPYHEFPYHGVEFRWSGPGASARTQLHWNRNSQQLEGHYSYIRIEEHSPLKSQGAALTERSLKAMQAMGVTQVSLYAAGERGSEDYNGYYTWPRLGFDLPLRQAYRRGLGGTLEEAQRFLSKPWEECTLLDLMATPAGRAWWKENGAGNDLTFDLTPGSRSWQALNAYLTERRARA